MKCKKEKKKCKQVGPCNVDCWSSPETTISPI